ncbi:hypothetical protein ACFSCX_06285 [Bacillus salitolerans]|uniref:Uncharacterized protein n=1 Tax=Bacillus salitolerans TaxID=1437434 RepID=A0ABW4LLX0_9BACI
MKKVVSFMLAVFFLMSATTILASASPFDSQKDINRMPFEHKEGSGDLTTFSLLGERANELLPVVYSTGIKFITVIFLAAVVVMAFSMMMKIGQWTKWSTGVMISSLLVLILFRGVPLIILTTNAMGVSVLAGDFLKVLTKVGIYSSVGMILVGLALRYIYKLITHPDYNRWSKRLFIGSTIILLLSTIMPFIFLGAA